MDIQMKILIDDLSMTWKYDNIYSLYEQLGITELNKQPIRTKYYNAGEYVDGILVAYNIDEQGSITDTYLDLSGKGCRTVEQLNSLAFDWFEFLHQYDSELRSGMCHISRIDIALDLEDNEMPMELLYKYTTSQLYVCRSKVLPDVRTMRTEEIYFGSPRSDRLLRIYNKALEQGIPDTYWIRLEFQLRNDCAMSWYLNWIKHRDVGKLYSGVLIDYLRFVTIPKDWKLSIDEIKQQRHQNKLPTAPFWQRILGDVQRIPQMYLPGEEYTLVQLEHYLKKQTYSSLRAYAIAHDGDITKLIDGVKHAKLNNKQRQIISNLRLNNNITKSDLEEQ